MCRGARPLVLFHGGERGVIDVPRASQHLQVLASDNMHMRGKLRCFQGDAQNLLGIINRGSPRLKQNALARELFGFGLEHRVTLNAECPPREENALADELTKPLIPYY